MGTIKKGTDEGTWGGIGSWIFLYVVFNFSRFASTSSGECWTNKRYIFYSTARQLNITYFLYLCSPEMMSVICAWTRTVPHLPVEPWAVRWMFTTLSDLNKNLPRLVFFITLCFNTYYFPGLPEGGGDRCRQEVGILRIYFMSSCVVAIVHLRRWK